MGLDESLTPNVLPIRIVVRGCTLRLDGGTIGLNATDEAERQVNIVLATTSPGGFGMTGRLYFNGYLVPMRSEHEAQILKLLSEATVLTPRTLPRGRGSRMAALGQDIKDFFERDTEDNCRAFIRQILEAVQSKSYLRWATDEEKAIAEEARSDEWERPTGKKKRRDWHRGRPW